MTSSESRAQEGANPRNILIIQLGKRQDDEGMHRVCGNECIQTFRDNPEFSCFHDGCEYECCGCGRCCAPEQCSATGKGYVWHQ